MSQIGLAPNNLSGKGLPSPQWVYLEQRFETMDDSTSFFGDMYGTKVPFVDQKLIDTGTLYIQRGRITDGKQRRDNVAMAYRREKTNIDRWSSHVAGSSQILGSGFLSGNHTGVIKDRPNCIPVTHIGMVTPELPYYAFYGNWKISAFSNNASPTYKIITNIPRMKGTKVSRMKDPVDFMVGGGDYGKTPQKTRDQVFSNTAFFARFVIIEDGKLKQAGPISEPLYIERSDPLFRNERVRSWEDLGGEIQAHLTIAEQYKE